MKIFTLLKDSMTSAAMMAGLFPVSPTQQAILRSQREQARQVLCRAGVAGFKAENSAKWVNVKRDWQGKLYVQIEHDTVRGCTPAMIRWWFENLGQKTTWDGQGFNGAEIAFYHLWHHRDHVAVTPLNGSHHGFAVGKKTRIQEQFNDHHERISVEVVTDRLDDEEFTFTVYIMGIKVCRIVHLYSSEAEGSRFYAETEVGFDLPVIGWLLNWFVLPFIYSKTTAEHWIRHNIEETGASEGIIPPLYHHYLGNRPTTEILP
ncbi:hypothetical protein [Agitococcus lubricus]|uniref:DAPG hydrolase PhiG domain-containing protein n=1 Tax=Agitococcus lubricus TaxID=1077255 RepID=A0A2T5J257_9GAMM|nr:hypothetical protein [Agitococcus lubricus]PTQ90609.1 hypothetical protein C8N29_1027 [Agitococcus lubricus]